MNPTRRHFTPDQKAQIVRRHLSGKEPVSNLADEFGLQPSQIHTWVKLVLDQAEKAFQPGPGRPPRIEQVKDKKIEHLQAKLVQKNEVIAELMDEHVQLKRTWGTLKGAWVPHDIRDQIVDYVNRWAERTELPARRLLGWLGLGTSKFHDWKHRYGQANEHNGTVPRDWWLEDWEKQAIVDYHDRHPREGYRRLTFMMLDDDVVATSPASVYRVLKAAAAARPAVVLALEEGGGLRAAALGSRALACGRVLHQHQRDVLLPHQPPRRLQPSDRALGDPRIDDRA